MKEARFCSRCGRQYEEPNNSSSPVGVSVYNRKNHMIRYYDVCPSCFDKIMSFIRCNSSVVPFALKYEKEEKEYAEVR